MQTLVKRLLSNSSIFGTLEYRYWFPSVAIFSYAFFNMQMHAQSNSNIVQQNTCNRENTLDRSVAYNCFWKNNLTSYLISTCLNFPLRINSSQLIYAYLSMCITTTLSKVDAKPVNPRHIPDCFLFSTIATSELYLYCKYQYWIDLTWKQLLNPTY